MTRTYSVQPGMPLGPLQEVRKVVVTPLGEGRFQVTIDDGPAEVVEARRLVAGRDPDLARVAATWSLISPSADGGEQYLCDVEGTVPDLKVAVASGEPVAFKLLDAREEAFLQLQAGARASGPVDVRSPMPGKVVKLLCKPGQEVKGGQGLLIIEAMKMENELRAPGDGVVREISAVEGQTVEGGAVLVSLGPPAGAQNAGPKA